MVHPHDNFALVCPPVVGSPVHLPTTIGSEGHRLRTGATWSTRCARWLPSLLSPPAPPVLPHVKRDIARVVHLTIFLPETRNWAYLNALLALT